MPTRNRHVIGGMLVSLGALMSSACVINDTSARGAVSVHGDHGYAMLVFSAHDRDAIHRYYRAHLPPGLAKREQLPPGLRKQLAKRGTLPPGLQSQHLPIDLEKQLSRLPAGYARLRVATDILLIDERTRVILDVVMDIGR